MDRREQSSVAKIQKEPVFPFGGMAKERGKGGRRHLEGNAWKKGRAGPGGRTRRRHAEVVRVEYECGGPCTRDGVAMEDAGDEDSSGSCKAGAFPRTKEHPGLSRDVNKASQQLAWDVRGCQIHQHTTQSGRARKDLGHLRIPLRFSQADAETWMGVGGMAVPGPRGDRRPVGQPGLALRPLPPSPCAASSSSCSHPMEFPATTLALRWGQQDLPSP